MWDSFQDAMQFSVVAFSSIFFLVDPFAAIPSFLAMTAMDPANKRRATARRAAITCFLVLSVFAAAGRYIFSMFGITLPAFEIAGGLILALVGLEMLQAKRSQTQESPSECEEGTEKDDPGILPLGIPMLAGPGAISTVMVLMGAHTQVWKAAAVFAAILVTSLLSFLILAGATGVRKFLGDTGIRIMMRLMGLLLTAIAIQFVINGLVHLKVIRG
jgi:multiple antibiotic resistance protein